MWKEKFMFIIALSGVFMVVSLCSKSFERNVNATKWPSVEQMTCSYARACVPFYVRIGRETDMGEIGLAKI